MLPDTFRTARLMLRPIAPRDAGAIFHTYAQDPEVTRFLTWRPHRSRDETERYITQCLSTPPQLARTFALLGRDDGVILGAFDLRQVQPHRLEFGYALARKWWGHGLMTEVLIEIVAWALAQPAIFRIGAVCDLENIGSARVMEKAGLFREGILRRWLVHPNISDQPRDCISYAKVR